MSTKKRKIGFYSFKLIDKENSELIHSPDILKPIIDYIMSLKPNERIYDVTSSNKFHLLHNVTDSGKIQTMIFKSAKYFHRPPLINKDNAVERDNPKELNEGESELTHIAFKYLEEEIVILLEERKVGLTINTLINYLKHFIEMFYEKNNREIDFNIEYFIIPKGNFLQELDNLKRVHFGNIYVDKQLLGSEFLDFSNRVEELQENVIITIKAKRKRNISEVIREAFNKLMSSKSIIRKIRVYGYTEEGNQILLDTDLVKKIEYVTVNPDDATGVVNSQDIFSKFFEILSE